MINTLLKYILTVLVLVGMYSCKENTSAEITNLYVSKTVDVVFSEELSLRATAKDEEEDPLTYTWECSGGTYVGTNSEVKWISPSKVGTYTLTVKVSDGSETVSKSKDVNVVGSYFYDFLNTSSQWAKNTSSIVEINKQTGIVSITSGDPSYAGSLSYNLPDSYELPYSFKSKVAVNSPNFIGGETYRTSFYMYFENPNPAELSNYLYSLCFHIRPCINAWEIKVGIYDATKGEVVYQLLETNSISSSKAIFTQNDEYHMVGVSIASDKTLAVNIDGEILYSSTALSTNATYNSDLKIFRIKHAVDPGLSFLVDKFYLTNDGAVLK